MLRKNRKYRGGTGFPEPTWRDHSFFQGVWSLQLCLGGPRSVRIPRHSPFKWTGWVKAPLPAESHAARRTHLTLPRPNGMRN